MAFGVFEPRYHQHDVSRYKERGWVERACAVGVYTGDWVLSYANSGGGADVAAVEWVCGEIVSGEYEAGSVCAAVMGGGGTDYSGPIKVSGGRKISL